MKKQKKQLDKKTKQKLIFVYYFFRRRKFMFPSITAKQKRWEYVLEKMSGVKRWTWQRWMKGVCPNKDNQSMISALYEFLIRKIRKEKRNRKFIDNKGLG